MTTVLLDLERVLADATEEFKGEYGPRNGKLFPSDLGVVRDGSSCKRAFWYKLRNEPSSDPSLESMTKRLMGDYLEDMVVDLLKQRLPVEGWRVIGTQVYADVPGTTGGKVDLLIEQMASGLKAVIEVKTTDSKGAKYLPKKGHMVQTQSYMKALDIQTGYLVYVFRDVGSTYQTFGVKRNDDEVISATNDLKVLADGPEPPPTDKPWQTQYCDLKTCRCRGK